MAQFELYPSGGSAGTSHTGNGNSVTFNLQQVKATLFVGTQDAVNGMDGATFSLQVSVDGSTFQTMSANAAVTTLGSLNFEHQNCILRGNVSSAGANTDIRAFILYQ